MLTMATMWQLWSSKPLYNFWWSGIADGQCAIRSGWCLLHLWNHYLWGPYFFRKSAKPRIQISKKSVSRHGNVYDILDSTNINSLENCLWNQPRKRMPTIMKSVHRTCFTSHCSTRFLWLSTNVTQILRGVNAKRFYLLHYLYALRTLSHSPLNKSR